MVRLIQSPKEWYGDWTGKLGNMRASGNHPNSNIIKLCLKTGKSPGDLRKLTVTQTPVRNHQLTLV